MLVRLIAAIAPALILMWYVYHKDIHPEPAKLVVKGFGYGALATFLSMVISVPLMAMGVFTNDPTNLVESIKVSFFGAAIPEETAKLVMLWLLLRNCSEFDERYDGIVYGAAVGLGFATLENLEYLLAAGADWYSVSVSRALFAVPGHFCFAVVMGYYYSQAHFLRSYAPKGTKLKMWLYPVLLHGTYDSIVFASGLNSVISGLCSIVLVVFCFKLFSFTRERIHKEVNDPDILAKILRDSAPEPGDNLPDEQ